MAMVRKPGFTLIELLVVIAVLGILVALIGASFATAQQRSRDAKRRADLQAIGKSLEQCYALNQVYPNAVSGGQALTCGSQTTMNLVPLDPKNSGSYVYTFTANGGLTGYCLCGLMEQGGSGNANTAGAGGGCSFGGSKNYQCVGSQQ